jgi:hypothetical protein
VAAAATAVVANRVCLPVMRLLTLSLRCPFMLARLLVVLKRL